MKFIPKTGIILLAVLLLALPILAACGGDDDDDVTPTASPTVTEEPTMEPTPEPTQEPTVAPTVEPTPEPTQEPTAAPSGPTWVYNVNYVDEDTVWTVGVVGEDTAEGVDCHVTKASFDTLPYRAFAVSPDTLLKFRYQMDWISKTTGDLIQKEMDINALEMVDLIATLTGTFATETHGVPFNVGDTWSVDYVNVLQPQVSDDTKMSWEVEVVGTEEVTVPAGTYECYKVVHSLVALDDVPEDSPTMKTEWWSVDSGFLCPVKVIDGAMYADTETQELVSYSE